MPLFFQALGCTLQNSGCGPLYLVKRRGKVASPRHICCWAVIIYCEVLWRIFNNMWRCFHSHTLDIAGEHKDRASCLLTVLVWCRWITGAMNQCTTQSDRSTAWQKVWSTLKKTVWEHWESKRGGVQGATTHLYRFQGHKSLWSQLLNKYKYDHRERKNKGWGVGSDMAGAS